MKKKWIAVCTLVLLASACGKKTQETKPVRKDITETVYASGILEARNTYSLTAQADGYLVAVNFNEGDIVAPGKVLAVVDNKESGFNRESANDLFVIAEKNTQNDAPSLVQAKNNMATAQQKKEQDLKQFKRYQELLAAKAIATVDYENVALQYQNSARNYDDAVENYRLLKTQAEQQLISTKAAKKVNETILTKNEIIAIVRGRVYKKYKQVGDYVKRGEAIALIGDADDIYAKINVDESNIAKIKIGQEALVQLNTQLGNNYKGIVSEIYPMFDDASQSFFCKIKFMDTLGFSIVNTQLQSNIITGVRKNALLIPKNYIDAGGFVQIKGMKEKTKINTAFASSDWVLVLGGIDENTVLETDDIAENKVKTSEAGASMAK